MISYRIKRGPGSGRNDEITTTAHPNMPDYRHTRESKFTVEEDGYPVVVMETVIGDDGRVMGHEQREILVGAHSWEEAKNMVSLAEDEEITEEGIKGLQDGHYEETPYYAVEVETPHS